MVRDIQIKKEKGILNEINEEFEMYNKHNIFVSKSIQVNAIILITKYCKI